MSVTLADGRVMRVRPLKAREMAELINAGLDDMHGLIRLAQLSAVNEDGSHVWESVEAAGDEAWPIIQRVADAAMAVNGIGDDSGNA